jgi:hypothetical protein
MVKKGQKKGPTLSELKVEVATLRERQAQERRFEKFNLAAQVFHSLFKWGGLVCISYFLYRSIDTLAGKETVATILVKAVANATISRTLSWGAALAFALLYFRQRKLRTDTIKHLAGQRKALELKHDPSRTSSRLTANGETREEDR